MTNRMIAYRYSWLGRAALAGVFATAAASSVLAAPTAHAQPAAPRPAGPAINLGQAMGIRIENSVNSDGPVRVGQSKLLLNMLLDTDTEGPFVLTIEQARRVIATGTCTATPVVYSGEVQEGEGYLRECVTADFPSSALRTNAPAEVVLAIVNDATDVRTELYRGSFPVIAFYDWTGNDNAGRPNHVEQRALRFDSFYGVGFVRQYLGNELDFTYVNTQNTDELPRDSGLRCRVGTGEWRAYDSSHGTHWSQTVRNRAYVGNQVHEDGNERIVTQVVHFQARMPIAVAGRSHTPEAGTSMDGAWTCEFRFGGAGTRVVAREFRFDVLNGYIQPHPIESQIRPGRGTVIVSIGMNPAAMPMIFDPALVRGNIAGIRLNGATAPLFSPMPARAINPTLTAPRGGGRGR